MPLQGHPRQLAVLTLSLWRGPVPPPSKAHSSPELSVPSLPPPPGLTPSHPFSHSHLLSRSVSSSPSAYEQTLVSIKMSKQKQLSLDFVTLSSYPKLCEGIV